MRRNVARLARDAGIGLSGRIDTSTDDKHRTKGAHPMKVAKIHWADIYRDGGSYGVGFDAEDGGNYEFFMRTKNSRRRARKAMSCP
jgi:hypothetical protein